jgi:protein ImuB
VYIPSYDDLTPSIPDITPGEAFAHVRRILPQDHGPVVDGSRAHADASSAQLFACLRSSHAPEALVAIARDFSPRLERHGPASVVLDASGLGRLLGDAQTIGTELQRAASVHDAPIRVAIARTQTAARLLAIGNALLAVAPGDPASAVAPLPLDTLRVLIGDDQLLRQAQDAALRQAQGSARRATTAARVEATATRLDTFRRWGLTTLGELAALPAADLSERMGQHGLMLQRLAAGADLSPLVPDPGIPRFIQRLELEWPIDALEPLSFVLARLLDPLSSALERSDRGAAALRLDLRLVDRTVHQRVLQLPAAMRDPRVLRTLLLLDLESHPPSAGIDIVTIEIDPAPARIVQYSLLERAMPSPETLATLDARLSALVGDTRCGSPLPLDTWRPDGFEIRRFNPASRTADGEVTAHRASQTANREPRIANRDVLVIRRYRPPVAVRVIVDHGRPARVFVDRRGMPGGQVLQAAGPWRTSGAWWGASPRTAWDRDEWDVALSDGSVCRLFHDRPGECWFLDGVID